MNKFLRTIGVILIVLVFMSHVSCQNLQSQIPAKGRLVSNQLPASPEFFKDSLVKPVGWVNDYENIFSLQQEKVLDSLIQVFEKESAIEIAILTIDTAMTTVKEFDNFVLHLHNAWGVGKKGKNNGIVIGISANYRRIRISNGTGITKILNDRETKLIVDKDFISYFKEGDYYGGTLRGLKSLIGKLKERLSD